MARLRGGYGEASEWLGRAKAGNSRLDGGGGRLSVEKVCDHCLSYVFSQRLPVIRLGENRLAEAFGNKAAVRFLGAFKDDFHSVSGMPRPPNRQGRLRGQTVDRLRSNELWRGKPAFAPSRFGEASRWLGKYP